ncbi:MAG TPA: Ig-like domain-containing protein, partial [Terracidiphilus sp.]|nr:Ig-like domain-containing protein [Terracidiphilus sp.]
TPATASIAAGATQQYTATGTYSNGSTQNITGAVTWTSSNAAAATINASGLATGVAAGSTTITATSGSIAGTASLTVSGSSSGSPSFRLGASPSTLTIAHGSSGTETITAAPAGGYTGTVLLTVDFGSADSTLANLCAGFGSSQSLQGSIAVAGTSPATTTLTLDANAADCADAAAVSRTGLHPLKQSASMAKLGPENRRPELPGPLPAGASFAGLVMIGYLGRRSRRLRNTTAVLILLAAAFTLSACGGQISLVGSASQTITNPQPGTYTGTITGHDSANAAITNTTTFTLVIQ